MHAFALSGPPQTQPSNLMSKVNLMLLSRTKRLRHLVIVVVVIFTIIIITTTTTIIIIIQSGVMYKSLPG